METGFLEDNQPIKFRRATDMQDAQITYKGKTVSISTDQIESTEALRLKCAELGLQNEIGWIADVLKARETFSLTGQPTIGAQE